MRCGRKARLVWPEGWHRLYRGPRNAPMLRFVWALTVGGREFDPCLWTPWDHLASTSARDDAYRKLERDCR